MVLSENVTVAQLQQQLKQLGQRHTGSKPQLIERLKLIQRKQAMGLPINDMEVRNAHLRAGDVSLPDYPCLTRTADLTRRRDALVYATNCQRI